MIRPAIFPLLAVVLVTGSRADTEVLREVRFEPPQFTEGTLPKLPWLEATGGGRSRVVPSGVEAFGQVLQISSPDSASENLVVRFSARRTGTLVVGFDVLTRVPARSLTMLVAPRNAKSDDVYSLATGYMTWDGQANAIRHFHERWLDVASYVPGRWHHVDALIHLSGPDAGTLDVNIDGGPFEAVGLAWRNPLPTDGSLAFDQVWFVGQQAPEGETLVDNISIGHVP